MLYTVLSVNFKVVIINLTVPVASKIERIFIPLWSGRSTFAKDSALVKLLATGLSVDHCFHIKDIFVNHLK
jgi:hypothetical protein